MPTALRVLIAEDRPDDAELMVRELIRSGFQPQWKRVETEEEYLKELQNSPDVILADHTMPQFDAPRATELLKKLNLDIPLLVVTGSVSEEAAVERIKQGAADYILKDRMARLGPAVKRALEQKELRDENRRATADLQARYRELQTLQEISQSVLNSLDVKQVLEGILDRAMALGAFDLGAICLLDPTRGLLKTAAIKGYRDPENAPRLRHSETETATTFLARALLQNEPQIEENIPAAEGLRGAKNEGVHSLIAVPVRAGNSALGVLHLSSRTPRKFQPEEIRLLGAIGSNVGIAIHNARLYEDIDVSRKELERTNRYLEKLLKQLSSLYTALAPLTLSGSVNEMLDGIIDRLMEATGGDAVQIRLLNKDSGRLVSASQRGFPDHYLKAVDVAPTGGAADWVFKTEQPLIAPDIAQDSRIKGKVQVQVGLRSCAILPLKAHNEIRGVVHLASRQVGYFDQEQNDNLMAIARQMGIALENRELFDELKASHAELERSNKVKDEFLSVMSHELRTPLTAVTGYVGLIKDGMLGDITRQQEEALQKVLNRTNDQLALVNNILFATVLEAEEIRVEKHRVNLGDFIGELKSTYGTPESKETTLNWQYPTEPPIIETDSAKLKHVLRNLIDNALKFTAKGRVTVSMDCDSSQGTAVLEVADTGVGIPKEHLPFIFDRFHQVDSSETRLHGGVGLGLYIAKRFIELVGGTLEVESELGRGSTFTVRIPLERE